MERQIEVLRVVRVPPMGKLVVIVGEARFTRLEEIANPRLKRQILAAVGELVTFAGGYDTIADAGYAPVREPVAATPREEPPLSPEQIRFLTELQRQGPPSVSTKELPPLPVTAQLQTQPESAPLPFAPPVAAAPPGSIAAQINEILVRFLAEEKELRQRDVHLEHTDQGGLRIMVDGRSYERPGQIEDQSVQLILRKALKEWDQR